MCEHECDSCTHGPEEAAKKTMEQIIEYGHQVRFIFPDPDSDEPYQFWYTVGRSLKERPELLLTGPLPPKVGQFILNEAAALDDQSPLVPGQEVAADTLLANYPCRIIAVGDMAEAEMFGALELDSDATALQIVWPDMKGRFPGERGYEYPKSAQPLFGVGSK